jgi:hypothetical protein
LQAKGRRPYRRHVSARNEKTWHRHPQWLTMTRYSHRH